MTTSINSLYTVMETAILHYLSPAEISRMSCLNKQWNAVANDPDAWKFARYHRIHVLDLHDREYEYADRDSIYINTLRKKEFNAREKLKKIVHHPSAGIISRCNDLTLTITTVEDFNTNEDALFFTTPAKEWLHAFHKMAFINLTSLSLCNCIITPNILKSIIRNSPKLQKFEHYLNHEITFEFICGIMEANNDDFSEACYNLITHPSLTHLRLSCVLCPGSVRALIKGLAKSKLEYLHCSVTRKYIVKHRNKINNLLTEISILNTLKSLLITSDGSSIINYKDIQILNSSSITYLNTSFPCNFIPGTFINLKELVITCNVKCQVFRWARPYIQEPGEAIKQDAEEIIKQEELSNFNEWLRQSKLENLCLIDSNFMRGVGKKHFMNILENHEFIKVLVLLDWNDEMKYTFCNEFDGIDKETIYENKYLMVDEQFSTRKFKSLKELRVVEREDAIEWEKSLATVFTIVENQSIINKKVLIDDPSWNKILSTFYCTEY